MQGPFKARLRTDSQSFLLYFICKTKLQSLPTFKQLWDQLHLLMRGSQSHIERVPFQWGVKNWGHVYYQSTFYFTLCPQFHTLPTCKLYEPPLPSQGAPKFLPIIILSSKSSILWSTSSLDKGLQMWHILIRDLWTKNTSYLYLSISIQQKTGRTGKLQ